MPKVFPNNQYWLRGGQMNQKRHFELTPAEKEKVESCRGIKEEHPCKNPVFRCSKCGYYGCDQEFVDKCSEQGFKNDKCLNCGSTDTRIPIMKEDFAKFVAEWAEEIPVVKD